MIRAATRSASRSMGIALRIALFSSLFIAPVGAFAYSAANTAGNGLSGAGFVLFVSLQRNAG
jgi:hypothetical protein